MKREANYHHGRKHAVKDHTNLGIDFYYFESEEDAKCWVKAQYRDWEKYLGLAKGGIVQKVESEIYNEDRGSISIELYHYSKYLDDWYKDLENLKERIKG